MIVDTTFHPRSDVLAGYALRLLGKAEADWVAEHVADCASCRAVLEQRAKEGVAYLSLIADLHGSSAPGAAQHSPFDSQAATVCQCVAQLATHDEQLIRLADAKRIPEALREHPRYRILDLLGYGGMGIVYLAEHRLMERLVALKVIHPSLVDRPGMVERFQREVKAAGRLLHPNIVPAFDAEEWRDVHFLVMEFVHGQDLERIACQQGPMPIGRACEYARQTALGLHYAFLQSMVHRDIKPHNLMVTDQGQVKILDFGLARFVSETVQLPDVEQEPLARHLYLKGLTHVPIGKDTGKGWMILGTPDYVAPEEARDARSADIRADIYSLGCTLYRLLTGQVPFPHEGLAEKIKAHFHDAPRPLGVLRPDAPPAVIRAIEQMMKKLPEERQQTPLEVAKELAPFSTRAGQ